MIKEPDMISFQKKPGKPSLTRQPNFVAEWRGSLVLDKKCLQKIKFGGAVFEMF